MTKFALISVGIMVLLLFCVGFGVGLNPLSDDDWDQDPDMDELNNRDEFLAGSDPNNWDTDGDGMPDGWEVQNKLDPTNPLDAEDDNDYFGGEEYASYSQVEPPYDNYAEYFRQAGVDRDTGEPVYRIILIQTAMVFLTQTILGPGILPTMERVALVMEAQIMATAEVVMPPEVAETVMVTATSMMTVTV